MSCQMHVTLLKTCVQRNPSYLAYLQVRRLLKCFLRFQPIHSNYNLFLPLVPCVCNCPKWSCLEMCAQHFLDFSWVSREINVRMKILSEKGRTRFHQTFHLYTFIGGISLIRFERLDLRMMKKRGCRGTALPLAGWNYWNLEGSAFIWVPVTKIILQGFRSLSAAQVQRRRECLHACTHTHRAWRTHMHGHAHLHKKKIKKWEVNNRGLEHSWIE